MTTKMIELTQDHPFLAAVVAMGPVIAGVAYVLGRLAEMLS